MDRRFSIHGHRQRHLWVGFVVGAVLLAAGCTDSGDGDGSAPTTTSTVAPAPAAEAGAPVTKFDVASFAEGAAADAAGVWLPQDSRLVRLDNTGAEVSDSRPAPPDRRGLGAAGLMAAGEGALFVASSSGLDSEGSEPAVFGWLARIDPHSGKVEATRRITDSKASPLSISVGSSGLWATTGTSLVRFDPRTLEKATVFDAAPPAGTGYGTVAVGDGAVYAGNAGSGRVVRFDLRNEQVTHEAEVGRKFGALPVVFTGSAVWAGGQDGLVELDPDNLSVRRRVAGPAANELAYYGDDIWVYAEDGLYVLRGRGTTVNRVANLGGSGHFGGLAIGGRYAWLGDYPNKVLWRVDIGG